MIQQITDNLSFYADSPIEKYRCDTFWDKEPETIAWIKSFKPDGVFLDIGANIGIYSCYAASLYPQMKIHAFEPVPSTILRLIENLDVNGFNRVSIYGVAVGDRVKNTNLYIPNMGIGASGAQTNYPEDEHGNAFVAQGVLGIEQITVDAFCVENDIKPNYIKIDIDGHEAEVVDGMANLLMNDPPDSILIEVNTDKIKPVDVCRKFMDAGYSFINQFNKMPNHSRVRRGGNPENIVFTR